MTSEELRDEWELIRESRRDMEKNRREAEARMTELERTVQETNRQLAALGDKWGYYTEGLAKPSMERLLRERFKMTAIHRNSTAKYDGRNLELDVFAYNRRTVFIVEIKSRIRSDDVKRLLRVLGRDFFNFFPEQRGKLLFGMLAGVEIPEDQRKHVLRHGLYLARIKDDVFELDIPEDFHPQAFGAVPDH